MELVLFSWLITVDAANQICLPQTADSTARGCSLSLCDSSMRSRCDYLHNVSKGGTPNVTFTHEAAAATCRCLGSSLEFCDDTHGMATSREPSH